MTDEILFLPGYAPNISARRVGLVSSRARSHAGKVAHKRRGKPSKTTKPFLLRPWRGNGDPFDVAGSIPLSPLVAEMLSFARTHHVPAPFAVPPYSNVAIIPWWGESALGGIIRVFSSLLEPTCAQAFLYAFTAPLHVVAHPAGSLMAAERLKLRGQALQGLGTAIDRSDPDSGTILRTSEYLFNAAVLSSNVVEAKLHGKIVCDILHGRAMQQGFHSINSNFLVRAMFKDAVISEYSQTPTIFDTDIWEPVLEAGLVLNENVPADSIPVPDEPACEGISHDFHFIFADARQALRVLCNLSSLYDVHDAQRWAYTRLVLAQCRAVNIYARAFRHTTGGDYRRKPPPGITKDVFRPWVETCLAAAVLLFVSLFRCWPEQHLYNNVKLILRQLQGSLEHTLSLLRIAREQSTNSGTDDDEILRSFNAPLLWALFIGAVVEANSNVGLGPTPSLAHGLHFQLQRMELTSWTDAEAVLATLVYSKMLLPPTETQRNQVLGPFRIRDQPVTSSDHDVIGEGPVFYHRADFMEFWNRSEPPMRTAMQFVDGQVT